MGARYTVLAVDHDDSSRQMLSALVEREGYAVSTAVSGPDALQALAEQQVDAVLLDSVLPDADGIDVLRSIKSDRRLCHLPVIMISAAEDGADLARCITMGADDCLPKSFDPALLRARLNGGLARKRLTDLEREYHKLIREQAARLAEANRDLRRRQSAQISPLAPGLVDRPLAVGRQGSRRQAIGPWSAARGPHSGEATDR
jgi:DNA-binding response OmpR family regulator